MSELGLDEAPWSSRSNVTRVKSHFNIFFFWIFLDSKLHDLVSFHSLVNSHHKPPRNPRWTYLGLKTPLCINGGCCDKSAVKFSATELTRPLRKTMLELGGFRLEVCMGSYVEVGGPHVEV
jgi:hypothetical protein